MHGLAYVKRVVAMAGDNVDACGLALTVNKVAPLHRVAAWLGEARKPAPFCAMLVPPKHVYVLGDNRAGSADSRYVGPIPESDIVGRALFIFAATDLAREWTDIP